MKCFSCGKEIELGENLEEDFITNGKLMCDDCYEEMMEVDEDERIN